MQEARRVLGSLDELTEFLREGPPECVQGVFRDAAFDLFKRGAGGAAALGAFAVGGLVGLGVVGAAAGGGLLCARIWLPSPLRIDLLLRSRDRLAPEETGLAQHFHLEATNPAFALRRLEGPLGATLIRLRARYDVEMRDDALDFGPFRHGPAEIAADLAAAIDAVARLDSKASGDAPPEEHLGKDASFCYFCGATLRKGAPICPSCGEQLEED